jgi:glyoxylase-like metal-dependent hydrolase (beta-lactamase superfamily II)
MDGSSIALRGRLACHCLLVELPDQLVLVDTGFGLGDVRSPRPRLSAFFLMLVAPELREEMTAIRQIERLGLDPRDVRNIILTHLDFDHAGGIDDFPHATVHLMGVERAEARAQRSWLDRQRYRPAQWHRHTLWREYSAGAGENWFGFECVRSLEGLPPELLLVPLRGHTLGHAGVALDTPDGWWLQAGDAYFHRNEMDLAHPRCTPGLRFYQWMLEKDRAARLHNQQRLRDLKRDCAVHVHSSHDVKEFEVLAERSLGAPAHALVHV